MRHTASKKRKDLLKWMVNCKPCKQLTSIAKATHVNANYGPNYYLCSACAQKEFSCLLDSTAKKK